MNQWWCSRQHVTRGLETWRRENHGQAPAAPVVMDGKYPNIIKICGYLPITIIYHLSSKYGNMWVFWMAKFHFAASRPSWSFHRGEGSEGLSWCVPFFGKALGPNGAFPPVSGTKTQAWRAENNENQWAVCRWEFVSFGVDENAAERHSWHGTGTTDDWWEALARKFQATKWWFLKLPNEIVMNSPKKVQFPGYKMSLPINMYIQYIYIYCDKYIYIYHY